MLGAKDGDGECAFNGTQEGIIAVMVLGGADGSADGFIDGNDEMEGDWYSKSQRTSHVSGHLLRSSCICASVMTGKYNNCSPQLYEARIQKLESQGLHMFCHRHSLMAAWLVFLAAPKVDL